MEAQKGEKTGLLPPALIREVLFFFFFFAYLLLQFSLKNTVHLFIPQGTIKHNIKRKTNQTKPSHTNLKEKLINPDVNEGF